MLRASWTKGAAKEKRRGEGWRVRRGRQGCIMILRQAVSSVRLSLTFTGAVGISRVTERCLWLVLGCHLEEQRWQRSGSRELADRICQIDNVWLSPLTPFPQSSCTDNAGGRWNELFLVSGSSSVLKRKNKWCYPVDDKERRREEVWIIRH